jgi:anaerobic glycerol-3-phosphate dehydrogenase
MTTEKRPVGRPTKYDPALCDKIADMGKEGLSRHQIGSRLGLHPANIGDWEKVHEEFRSALQQAKQHALEYWETLAQNHMIENPGGPRINTGLWSRSMAARFPNEYRENNKVEVVGKNDGAIQVDVVHDFAKDLVADLLAARQSDAESSDS